MVAFLASSVRLVIFHKVVWQHYSGDLGEFFISDVKLPKNSVYQKLLKSVYFSLSYSKYKGSVFETVYPLEPVKLVGVG